MTRSLPVVWAMVDLASKRLPAGLLVLGFALAWLPWLWPTPWAAIGLVAAQPMLVLAWSGIRNSRNFVRPAFSLLADAMSVSLLWSLAFALLAVAVTWPLESLLESGALFPVLVLSLCSGCVLLGVWRLWPAFAQAARHGQSFTSLLSAATRTGRLELGRGLAITVSVFFVMALGLALGWPGILVEPWRQPLLLSFPVLALLAHICVHKVADRLPTPALAAAESLAALAPISEAPLESLDVGSPDENLFAALRNGRVEQALAALAAGANAHALPPESDRDQRALPMLAALQSDLRVLRQLIARGVDLNQAFGGLTPLLAATRDSWHGRPEAVMTLLANGADPRIADADGNTPLHHAARSTDPAVAALLLDAGAQVDAINVEGMGPLGIACASGNWRLARFLIEHGGKPEPGNGQPALIAAVMGDDDPAGVQLLLRHKARVDARGFDHRTALMQACVAGNADIVGVLLEAGADRNARDAHGMTPLLEAARGANIDVVSRLALARPNPLAEDNQQRNALIHACLAGASPQILSQLLAIGVDDEHRDDQGRRAIDIAIEKGRWPDVAVLDPSYALPANVAEGLADGAPIKAPHQLLREALSARRFDAAEAMLRIGSGMAPEMLAALLLQSVADDDLIAFQWLCRHGAPADLAMAGQDCVLFHLLDQGGRALPALNLLLDHGQSVGGYAGLSRFLSTCLDSEHTSRGIEQFGLALIERGVDVFGARTNQDTPLILAIRLGWQRVIEVLLSSGVDPNQRDCRGHSAIQLASTLGRESAIRALIRYGGQPSTRSPDGQTALGMALAASRHDLSYWLEWRGWALPGRALRESDLSAAAIAGDHDAVRRLLELGLPVNALDAQGCTALLRAAGGGYGEIVQILLDKGADPSLSARTGATALSAAISMHHGAVVAQLLQAGASAQQALPGGVTPLMLAAALGLPDIAGHLLGHAADAGAVDEQGLNALHCAALHGFGSRERQRALVLFDQLLLTGIAVDATNSAGDTALMLLLGARAEAGSTGDEEVLLALLDRLLAEGAHLDLQDRRGLSALHIAALHGFARVVQRLLREGANRQLRDSLGRSAYDLAVLRGYVDIASEFEPARSTPSLARFLREPR